MNGFLAEQPNGLLCYFDNELETVAYVDVDRESYARICADKARDEARKAWDKKQLKIEPYEKVLQSITDRNETRDNLENTLREMGDETTDVDDLGIFIKY